MQGWLRELSPRQRGLTILICSLALVVINLLVSRTMGSYYPLLFPMAGFLAPMGAYMVITGFGEQDFRAQRAPRWQLGLVFFGMIACGIAGLRANDAFFGGPF